MVFVTIGTSEPFDRLLDALGGIEDDLIVQCGDSSCRPSGASCVAYLDYDELVDCLRRADAVVCHAGVGTILTALEHGHRPVVVARRSSLGEAVDDHQLVLARRLGELGVVEHVEELRELPDAVRRVRGKRVTPIGSRLPLVEELGTFIRDQLAP
jgi:UDP-N-acetylglucosamine transferase subunit ALG13